MDSLEAKIRESLSSNDIQGKTLELGENFEIGKIGIMDLFQSAWNNSLVAETLHSMPKKLQSGDPLALMIVSFSIFIGASTIFILGNIFLGNSPDSQSSNKNIKEEEEKEEPEPQRDFTISQLREFDGTNGKPIYISLRREVYDVSKAGEFYGVGSGYHCFAGREASRAMAKFSFDESEISNPSLEGLGPFELSSLDDWVSKFKDYKQYPVVGKVTIPLTNLKFKREELKAFDGEQEVPAERIDAPIYVGVSGKVLDVSYGGKEMYGKGGPYHIFAGIDASRALAKMSFNEEDLKSNDLSDLTPEQLKVLGDWEKKFVETRKYPVVGEIVE